MHYKGYHFSLFGCDIYCLIPTGRSVCYVSYTGLVWPIKVSIWTHCSIPLVLCKGLLKHLIVYLNKIIVVSVRTEMTFIFVADAL